MANVEIQDITAILTTPATGMWIPVADGVVTKRITHANFFTDVDEIDGGKTAGEDIIIKGSTQNDGGVQLNPAGGSVGIGTAAAIDQRLHVQGASATEMIKIESTAANSQALYESRNDVNVYRLGCDTDDSWFLKDITGAHELLSFAVGGNLTIMPDSGEVGIGTGTIDERLHVEGTGATEKIKIESTAANGLAGFETRNDAQGFTWRVNGGDSDNMQLRDETNSTSPIIIEPNTPSNSLRLDGTTGNVILGGSVVPATLAGGLVFNNGTAPTAGLAGGCSMHARDVSASSELFATDESNTESQLTSHSPEMEGMAKALRNDPFPYIYKHFNPHLGLRQHVWMTELARQVEKLSGVQLIWEEHTPPILWNGKRPPAPWVAERIKHLKIRN